MRNFGLNPSRAILLSPLLLMSCMSYYQRNLEFNQYFESGELEKARSVLEKDSKAETKKNRFLYFVNLGTVNSLLGNYEESNEWFEKAYIFHEDERKNAGDVAATYLVNASATLYLGEDQEHLYVLYYKALNFMKMGRFEEAMVEVRRMEILLNQLDDKYKSDEKFNKDAFVNLLMGLVYDAQGDINNAFIAYRNAVEVYEGDYKKFFNMSTPVQLKKDLLRTAKQMGFQNEVAFYEKKFDMKAPKPLPKDSAHLTMIWHNGLGPVKDSWEIAFIIVPAPGRSDLVYIRNDEFGFVFPFHVSGNDRNSLTDLRTFKIAFPKYIERKKIYQNGSVSFGNVRSNFEVAESINKVSFKVLNQRMLLEMGQAILRVALKKAAEKALRENDKQGAALAMAIYSYASEQADTRNWQTLPHSIDYVRINTPPGQQELRLNMSSGKTGAGSSQKTIKVTGEAGKTSFFTYHSLDYVKIVAARPGY
jgi:uncharacterized protein